MIIAKPEAVQASSMLMPMLSYCLKGSTPPQVRLMHAHSNENGRLPSFDPYNRFSIGDVKLGGDQINGSANDSAGQSEY